MTSTALITGASSGIGRELALIHAEKGGDLIIVARDSEALQKLADEVKKLYKTEVKIIPKDLSQPNASQEIYDELKEENIQIDILINNAGFGGVGKFHEQDWKLYSEMLQVNITALTELTHLFLSDFVKRNEGKILNIASIGGLFPGPFHAVYFATKAYVISFTEAIASEVFKSNVTITALLPGATHTNFAKRAGMEHSSAFHHAASARRVAEQGYRGMMKGKIQVLTGIDWFEKLYLFLGRFVPKRFLLGMVGRTQKSL